jgi:hypothetical protein
MAYTDYEKILSEVEPAINSSKTFTHIQDKNYIILVAILAGPFYLAHSNFD